MIVVMNAPCARFSFGSVQNRLPSKKLINNETHWQNDNRTKKKTKTISAFIDVFYGSLSFGPSMCVYLKFSPGKKKFQDAEVKLNAIGQSFYLFHLANFHRFWYCSNINFQQHRILVVLSVYHKLNESNKWKRKAKRKLTDSNRHYPMWINGSLMIWFRFRLVFSLALFIDTFVIVFALFICQTENENEAKATKNKNQTKRNNLIEKINSIKCIFFVVVVVVDVFLMLLCLYRFNVALFFSLQSIPFKRSE